jgi:hypothetical protein
MVQTYAISCSVACFSSLPSFHQRVHEFSGLTPSTYLAQRGEYFNYVPPTQVSCVAKLIYPAISGEQGRHGGGSFVDFSTINYFAGSFGWIIHLHLGRSLVFANALRQGLDEGKTNRHGRSRVQQSAEVWLVISLCICDGVAFAASRIICRKLIGTLGQVERESAGSPFCGKREPFSLPNRAGFAP